MASTKHINLMVTKLMKTSLTKAPNYVTVIRYIIVSISVTTGISGQYGVWKACLRPGLAPCSPNRSSTSTTHTMTVLNIVTATTVVASATLLRPTKLLSQTVVTLTSLLVTTV